MKAEDNGNVIIFGADGQEDLTTPSAQFHSGYLKNGYIQRCCDQYGTRISSIDRLYYDDTGEQIPNTSEHPFIKLMENPNPFMTGNELLFNIGRSYGIFGEAFLYPEKTPTGWTLWFIDPIQMSADVGASDLTEPVKMWRVSKPIHGRATFAPNEIIHIKRASPDVTNPRGVSPMVGCAKSVLMLNAIHDWNTSILNNGGKPYLCLKIPGPITADNRDKLSTELNGRWGGAHNTGKGIVLDNGKELETLGFTATDMDFQTGMRECVREIATAYGEPAEKLADASTRTYSNAVEAAREEIANVIKPLLERIYPAIWAFFKGTNIAKGISNFTYDVEQLTDNMGAQVELYTALQTTTFLTPNEKRAKLGYEPIDNPIADELMLSPTDTPMSDYADVPLDNGDDLYRLLQDGQ